jgi:large subunit ribosomal protein L15
MKKLKFHHLKPTPGSTKQKLRKGRGEAGKRGKTAGRGTKGTGARKTVPAYFEGGQIPLYRRIPKLRGLKNGPKMAYVVVNLNELEERGVEGEVTPDTLRELGLTRKKGLVKVLGDGDLSKKIDLKIHAISETAKTKIESAGGSVELIKE